MALSATCGLQVLKDLISILDLKGVVSGEGNREKTILIIVTIPYFLVDAPMQGTVFFSSPLYRKNLHYRVEPKPDSAKDQLEMMKNYILENHLNETGIIYCLSKKVPFLLPRRCLSMFDEFSGYRGCCRAIRETEWRAH